jgi:acylphosphatase
MSDIRRAHIVTSGRVQGVGYRYETHSRAVSLGLSGWVTNRLDGSVEAAFEGPAERVELLLHWCREGSPSAYVDQIDIEWQEPTGEQGFRVR